MNEHDKTKEKYEGKNFAEVAKELKITDNPFDVMVYHALEMARDVLFSCNRLRCGHIGLENKTISEYILNYNFQYILQNYQKIMEMPQECVDICRKHCIYDEIFKRPNYINDTLLSLENAMHTVWTEDRPCRDIDYEKSRLGEDSDEYKRLLELRSLVDSEKNLAKFCKDLHRMNDVIRHGKMAIEYGFCEEYEYEYLKKFVDDNKLNYTDIRYMISYCKILMEEK